MRFARLRHSPSCICRDSSHVECCSATNEAVRPVAGEHGPYSPVFVPVRRLGRGGDGAGERFGDPADSQSGDGSVVVLPPASPLFPGRIARRYQGSFGEFEQAGPQRTGHLDTTGHRVHGPMFERPVIGVDGPRESPFRPLTPTRLAEHDSDRIAPEAETVLRALPGRRAYPTLAVGSNVESASHSAFAPVDLGAAIPRDWTLRQHVPATTIPPSTLVSRASEHAPCSNARARARSSASLATETAGWPAASSTSTPSSRRSSRRGRGGVRSSADSAASSGVSASNPRAWSQSTANAASSSAPAGTPSPRNAF